jgi:hypothetical protein
MMSRRLWIVLGIVVLLAVVSLMVWQGGRRPASRLPTLQLQVESLGQFPQPPATRGVHVAFPVDLNGDGETEAVAVFAKITLKHGEPGVWTDLKGKFQKLPVPVIYDWELALYPKNAPETRRQPLLREVLGWNPESGQIVRVQSITPLRLETITSLHPERVLHSEMVDADLDGELDTMIVQLPSRFVAFQLNSARQWQLVKTPLPAPQEVVRQLEQQVSAVVPHPSGLPAVQIPGKFFHQKPRPFVPLPDGDGDGIPERLNTLNRTVLFSSGKKTPFPHPFEAGEQFLTAELDGRAPTELVYIHHDQHGVTALVYQLEAGKLRLIAKQALVEADYAPFAARDLDGDGRDELISVKNNDRHTVRWHVWRYEAFKFQPMSETHRTPLELTYAPVERVLAGKKTLAGLTSHKIVDRREVAAPTSSTETSGFQLGAFKTIYSGRSATILAGLPDAAPQNSPDRWKSIVLDGRVLWYGDFDNDGHEEYALTRPEGGAIAQFRDGVWRVSDLQRGAPLTAAFPAQRHGKPCLILVYQNGVVEAARMGR